MAYTIEQLSDIEMIRDATKRYSYGVDRLDPEVMKSAYWPDGTDDHGVFVGNAHEFVEHCMVAHLGWKSTMHCVYNHQIKLEDDGAHARGELYNVTHLLKEDGTHDHWYGRYLDEYEKREGEWRILNRVCVHEGTSTGPTDTMAIESDKFRQGAFDRPTTNRPIGP